MKIWKSWAFVSAIVLIAACSEKHESFYSTSYPVTNVEATVTVENASALDDAAQSQIEEIKSAIVEEAPVKSGGRYTLEYFEYNSGTLRVLPAPDATVVIGTFIKEPDTADSLKFSFGDYDYTCVATSYTDNDQKLTLLNVDLTDKYTELYPDLNITAATRKEYTSHPY